MFAFGFRQIGDEKEEEEENGAMGVIEEKTSALKS